MLNFVHERSAFIQRLALQAVNAGRPFPIVDSHILAVILETQVQCTLQELRRELRHLAKLGFVHIARAGAPPARVQVTLTPKGVGAVYWQLSDANKAYLAALLQTHVGRDLAITSTAIAGALGCDEHLVHSLVAALREDGIAVCGHPEGSYYIAATSDELGETCAALRSRAMQTLAAEAKMRHVPLYRVIDQIWLRQAGY